MKSYEPNQTFSCFMSSTNGFCWCHRSTTVVLVGQVEVSAVITEQSVSHEAPVVRKAQGMGSVAHESIYFGSLFFLNKMVTIR